MPLDVLFHLEELVSEGLSHILGLKGQAGLELGLFLLERRHLRLVEMEVVLEGANHFLNRDDLALDVSRVG